MSGGSLQPPRKVLFVSYYAPPFGGPQGFRAAQFLSHLPEFGWEPTLLTVAARAYADDPGPSDDVSFAGTRAGAIETSMIPLDRWVERVKGRRDGGGGITAAAATSTGGYPLLTRASAMLATPDRLVGWVPHAVRAGLAAARDADLIHGAGPPYTNHLAAIALARLSGTPLSVMVDDPWVSMSHRTWYSDRQRRAHERLERASMRRASVVLAGTEGFGADLAARHPDAGVAEKLHVVRWGYEPGSVPTDVEAPPAPPVRFIYTGSLRGAQYDPSALFATLASMLERDPGLSSRVRFDFYGGTDPAYAALAARPPLEDVVRMHGFRPHAEVSAEIRRSHAAVLLIGDSHPELRWYESAKLFTYAGSGRPTLAIVPPGGDAARLVESRGLGLVAPSGDREAIAAAIGRLEGEHAELAPGPERVAGLDSRSVIGDAARAFDAAVGGATG